MRHHRAVRPGGRPHCAGQPSGLVQVVGDAGGPHHSGAGVGEEEVGRRMNVGAVDAGVGEDRGSDEGLSYGGRSL